MQAVSLDGTLKSPLWSGRSVWPRGPGLGLEEEGGLALGAALWWRWSLHPAEQSPGTREAGELAEGGLAGASADGREETGTLSESQARAPASARRPHQTPDPLPRGQHSGARTGSPSGWGAHWSAGGVPSLQPCAPAPPVCPPCFPGCPEAGLTAAESRPAEFCCALPAAVPPMLALRFSPGAWVLVPLGSPDQASLTTFAVKAQDNRHTSCTCVCKTSGQSQRSVPFENCNLEPALVPHEGSWPLLQP